MSAFSKCKKLIDVEVEFIAGDLIAKIDLLMMELKKFLINKSHTHIFV